MSIKLPQSIQLSVDDGEKIELKEIQEELNESRSQNDELEAQLSIYRQRLKRVENNTATINRLSGDVTTWLTIGKMFVKYARKEVENEMDKELNMYQKKVSDLETAHKRVLDNLNRRQKRFESFVEKHRFDPSKDANKNAAAQDSQS
mmetsp:Transcript_13410/g.20262  ORF Transcript_13410/g.20262 Transcript_13410/m.20262 type:complete len:147 (+) Transcript_13410:60-500(+)|eukprot:CAMPEP_0202692750 /NCGR_PEP_ID=MMETSP1385-20130828/7057_1 /ASSEMBLY_ACC=CAM_ASM_000861 /TAXON_ID=933848 /ORGANISM="Elphidium margaritaceum" /LENGTH=146 /DNA_ID=CAMNT_0049348337 /DNA_START=19 /DNA_END=459 /DNA_ORIENTATION=+